MLVTQKGSFPSQAVDYIVLAQKSFGCFKGVEGESRGPVSMILLTPGRKK